MLVSDLLAPNLLVGKSAFITGGGSGINFAIADAMASVGANVAICGRSQERLDAATARLRRHGHLAIAVAADVRESDAMHHALDTAACAFGQLDIVVAGAAGNFFGAATDITPKGFRAVIDIDLVGSFNTAQAAFHHLRASKGNIVFISAGQSYMAFANQCHVGAAKAGVDNLMANLAFEWGRFGVRSNSIVPGPIQETEGMRRLTEPIGERVWTEALPLGRFGRAEEVAAMVVVVASPLGSYVTGSRIVVDGGLGLSGLGAISQALSAATDSAGLDRSAVDGNDDGAVDAVV